MLEPVGPEWRAVFMFQESLPDMLPIDLCAFLECAKPTMPLAVLFILAQLWEPEATRCFAAAIAPHLPHPSGEHLATALQSTLRHMDDLRQALGAPWDTCCKQVEILREQGLQRHLGPATLAQRMGVAQKSDRGTLRVSKGGELLLLRAATSPACSEVAEKLRESPRVPTSPAQVRAVASAMEAKLRSLKSWACMAGDYLRKHVMRKIMLKLCEDLPPATEWGRLPLSALSLDTCSPDRHGFLKKLPATWTVAELAALAPHVAPAMLSMWPCLFRKALADEKARAWVAGGNAAAFAAAAAEVKSEQGFTPSPLQVLLRAASRRL